MVDDGTLGRAVFKALRKHFTDEERARDLMGAMSALGMVYFESIKAATAELVQRDLRIEREEAVWVVDAGNEAVAQLERPEHTVMVAQKGKAQAQKARMSDIVTKDMSVRTPAHKALAHKSTLREALVKECPERKTKPSTRRPHHMVRYQSGALYCGRDVTTAVRSPLLPPAYSGTAVAGFAY